MNARTTVRAALFAAALAIAGFASYQWGLRQGGTAVPAPVVASASAPTMAASTVDPARWGIPEGEQATRRHIEAGLKQGDVDPVTGRKILYYHDPMVPGQKFESPGKSPFMDMMLVPAYPGSEGADNGTLRISPRIQQNLGVRTGTVGRGVLRTEVVATGTVAWNERGQVTVQARATGFVERLHVRAALDRVAKGQPLLDLYVPDWVAVQEDHLNARRMQATGLVSLADAARQRMRQAGMDETQIARVESSGQVQPRLTLRAPAAGVVTELTTREGATVMPGAPLMRINETASVWVHAEVPESQVALIGTRTRVTAESPAWPGEVFRGQVQDLLPEVNPVTRTRRARMQLTNPGGKLVPGMFVQVHLTGKPAPATLLVPSEALVRTGQRTLVMRVEGEAFRPVVVQVGREQGGQAEILAGLEEGQQIVLSGQFLIDSEASLKGVEARMPAELARDAQAVVGSGLQDAAPQNGAKP